MGVRVLTVFGTRPEAIKLFPVIRALDADPRFESRVCVTGQHRELLEEVLRFAGIDPDFDLEIRRRGSDLIDLAARTLAALQPRIERERPDWVVVQGDTTSALAAALAAHYARIPVCHVEAGLRSGDSGNPWPEEANRRMISVLADLHCAPTASAAAALRREGIAPDAIEMTGNPGIDALHFVRERLNGLPALASLTNCKPSKRLVLTTIHRRENQGDKLQSIAEGLIRIAARGDVRIVLPVHPSGAVSGPLQRLLGSVEGISLVEPLAYPNFVEMLGACHFVLSDSGGIQEEAPALGTPVLVLRDFTERPEAVEAGTALLVGTDPAAIASAASLLLDDPAAYQAMARAFSPFGDGRAAQRIVESLAASSARVPALSAQTR